MADFDDVLDKTLGGIDFNPRELKAKYLEERDKRVRTDANAQYIEVTGDFSNFVDDPYAPAAERKPVTDHVDVVIVGGGFGGLLMGGRLREAGFDDIRVIEKGGDFGGTWYWNRYPGAMCDVESYCYLPMLEELGYVPKHKYSFAPEIMEHSKNIATHYGLYDNALLSTGVTHTEWNDDTDRWTITTDRGDEMTARVIVMANGPLNRPKLPGIDGINDFGGHTFHTSRWDYEYTGGSNEGGLDGLANKRVGIIGTGATAVQCVPHLGAAAKELYVFQRTPSSVDVRNNRETPPDFLEGQETGWQYRRMDNFNKLVTGADQDEDLVNDGWTDIFRKLTGIAAKTASKELGRRLTRHERAELMEMADYRKMESVRRRAQEIVDDPDVAESLKPYYRQFCKRPCFHDEYLPTFNLANVHLVDTDGKGVERFTETGLVANGEHIELDCIIFATGFEVGTNYVRRAGYDTVGRAGRQLSEKWKNGLRTVHGLQTEGFPNAFFMGFNQGAVTVNIPQTLNEQAVQIAYMLDQVRARGGSQIEATPEGEQAWVDEMIDKERLGAKFRAECTPGYYNNEGVAENPNGFFSANYGAGPVRFFEILSDWREQGDLEGCTVT
ncbi:MAG: cation diffusion facilitator CzcD-associated flavoprotein CzcO [Ilumatobacter sp.]|jgi:cation diffusion facilitator CzcD-associated flavoprotein CzcO|tara:strand:- start:6 stop:1838 length:1833 start_codon:yes stop_codon:yes gene_type:complete